MEKSDVLRLPAEKLYEDELDFLKSIDKGDKPTGWQLSPKNVYNYIVGGKIEGKEIVPKYIGHDRLVEISIATLLTDRSLLLIGEPGTAKSWLSEHLTAAICGSSSYVIQGTAGTTEEHIKYSWNYAMLLANGPSDESLIKSPIMRAMEGGKIARFEEISRCALEVQDAMISLLSEKNVVVPELSKEVNAKRGFSVIATANTRDKGVHDMSSALKRRFNIVILPPPKSVEIEVGIIEKRVKEMVSNYDIAAKMPSSNEIERVVTIFRELRNGETMDKKEKLKTTSSVVSTAEAISLLTNSMALSSSFGNGKITEDDIAAGLMGAVVKDENKDAIVWREYIENVMKKRGAEWRSLYNACKKITD